MLLNTETKLRELRVAGRRAKRRFLFDTSISFKARAVLAVLHEHSPEGKLALRELEKLSGGRRWATRTAVEELLNHHYVTLDAGDVELLAHPLEGGRYTDPGNFRSMEILALGHYHGRTVMVGKLDTGELVTAPVELWHTAAFNNPRLLDRVRYDSNHRGSGRLLGRYVDVIKSGDEILLKEHPN